MTTEETNQATSRRRVVAATARRVKRTVTSPFHRSHRPSLPTPAAPAFVGPDGRSYWLLESGDGVAVLVSQAGLRPEMFDLVLSEGADGRLDATAVRIGDPTAERAETGNEVVRADEARATAVGADDPAVEPTRSADEIDRAAGGDTDADNATPSAA